VSTGLNTPRLTAIERDAIPSPSTDQIIFNIDSGTHESWDGSAWATFGGGGGGGGGFPGRGFVEDDFLGGGFSTGTIGSLGWSHNLQGTHAYIDAPAGHLGIYQRITTSTSYTANFLSVTASTGAMHPADSFANLWNLQLVQNDIDTFARFGASGNPSSLTPVSGIYIEKLFADVTWFAVCRAFSVETRVALPLVDLLYHDFSIRRVDETTIGFTVDGGTEFTINTNVPTVPLLPFFGIQRGAGVNKSINIDYFSLDIGI